MATTYSVKTVISAQDKLSSPLKQITSSAVATARGATDKIGEGAKEASGHFFSLGGAITGALGALAGGLSIAGIGSMINGYVQATDELGNLSAQLGISGQSLREFAYVANFADVENEKVTSSLEFLAKAVGQAQGGYGKLIKTLGKQPNGRILLEQLKAAKGTEEAFELATTAVDRIKNPMQQAALATALFGGNAKDMIRFSKGGIDAIDKMRAQARQDIGIITPQMIQDAGDFDDEMKRVAYQFKGFAGVIARELMPVLQPMMANFRGVAHELRPLIKAQVAKWAKDAGNALKGIDWGKTIAGVKEFGSQIKGAHDAIGGFKTEAMLLGAYLGVGLVVQGAHGALAMIALAKEARAFGVVAMAAGTQIREMGSAIRFGFSWVGLPLGPLAAIVASVGVIAYELMEAYRVYEKFTKDPRDVPRTVGADKFGADPLQLPVDANYTTRSHTYHINDFHAGAGKEATAEAWKPWGGIGDDSAMFMPDADAPTESRDPSKRPPMLGGGKNGGGTTTQQVKGEMVVRIDSPNAAASVTSVRSSQPWFNVTGNVGASPAGSRF